MILDNPSNLFVTESEQQSAECTVQCLPFNNRENWNQDLNPHNMLEKSYVDDDTGHVDRTV